MSEATSWSLCRKIIAEADCSELVGEILEVLGRAAFEMHTERGRLAFWLAIVTIGEDERKPVEQRQAARLILAHDLRTIDANCDSECRCAVADRLADMGDGDFDAACVVADAVCRAAETTVAVIDVWLSLLPELATIGTDWLDTLKPTIGT
jgi:hypothetical protein